MRSNIRHDIAVIVATVVLTLAAVWGAASYARHREAQEPELLNTQISGVRLYRTWTRDAGFVIVAVDDNRNVVALR